MKPQSVRKKITGIWLSGLVIAILAGCAAEEESKLGEVTGTITLDGQPVDGAVVQFVPQGPDGTTSYGLSDKEGRYEMAFSSFDKGVLLGENLVRITSNDDVLVNGKTYSFIEIFPEKYNVGSEIIAKVVPGKNEFNYDCESDEASRQVMSEEKKEPGIEGINF